MDARLQCELKVRGYELSGSGRVSPATLLRYLEGVRWEAIQTIPAVGELFANGRFTVVRAQRLEVLRVLTVGDELVGAVWPGKLGRSSVELRHELTLKRSGELVARAAVVGVHLDGSGRPCSLPEALRAVAVDESEWLPIRPLFEGERPSASAFLDRVHVRPSHIDSFHHANHAAYVDWIDDARQVAAAAASPLASGPLRRLSIEYRREAVLGDELTVLSWLLPDALGCEVRRGDEPEPLCRARLEIE